MDCLLDEIYRLKKFKKKYPKVREFDDPPKKKKKSGFGRFTFHGGFKNKADAKRKEKEIGGFIREKNNRYYVLKEK